MSSMITIAGSSIGANMICPTVNAACDAVRIVASGRTSMVPRQLMRGHSERVSLETEAELQLVENLRADSTQTSTGRPSYPNAALRRPTTSKNAPVEKGRVQRHSRRGE